MSGKQNNKKECHSVILAALLHDIGKFLHRGSAKEYQVSHPEASGMFLEKFEFKLKK